MCIPNRNVFQVGRVRRILTQATSEEQQQPGGSLHRVVINTGVFRCCVFRCSVSSTIEPGTRSKERVLSQDQQKLAAAQAAIDYIEAGAIIGVGTGSTVDLFIDRLAAIKSRIDGAVSSSVRSQERMQAAGIRVLDLNTSGALPVYIDGADECTEHKHLIKGGGGALTREKIVAEASDKFVCIVDSAKIVDVLGKFPLPIEVLPMAQSLVARKLTTLGGKPVLREGFETDNGNVILDVHNLEITNPVELESQINNVPGVVTNGLFARRGADVVLIGAADGVNRID